MQVNGAILLRRIIFTKFQIPDSFPYLLERDFGENVALEYERYVALCQRERNQMIDVEQLDRY